MSNYVCISFIQAFALPFPWIYNSHSRRLCISLIPQHFSLTIFIETAEAAKSVKMNSVDGFPNLYTVELKKEEIETKPYVKFIDESGKRLGEIYYFGEDSSVELCVDFAEINFVQLFLLFLLSLGKSLFLFLFCKQSGRAHV